METPETIRTSLQAGGMGYLHRFQRRILPHTNKQPVQEVHAFSHPRQNLSIQSTTIWSLNCTSEVYNSGQRGQVTCTAEGYKDPPVPRRLVGESQVPPNLSSTHTDPSNSLSGGYQFDLKEGRVRDTPEHWQTLQTKIVDLMSSPLCLIWNLMSLIGLLTATHETHTVASQKQLEGSRDTGKGDPHSKVTPPTSDMVAGGKQRTHRSTITPTKTCSANLYRCIKRRVGAHLNEHTARGDWSLPESKLHINYLELKAVFLALKKFQDLCSNHMSS